MNSRNRVARTAAIAFGLFATGVPAQAALVDATWNGGVGNWNNVALWTPNVIPNNGTGGNTYHVRIDNGNAAVSTVSMDINPTIDRLTVTSGDTLSLPNSSALFMAVGPIANDGVISMNSSGGGSTLHIQASMSLTGTGVLSLSNDTFNSIQAQGGFRTLTHGATHTIRGAGGLGGNGLQLINHGLIDGNQTTGLQVDLADSFGQSSNDGVIQSSGSGLLALISSPVNNTDGVIQALDASLFTIQQCDIIGGVFHTTGTGAIRPFALSTLRDFTLTGLIRQQNGDLAVYGGTITNHGTISLESTGSTTAMRLLNVPTTFTGTGTIVMSNNTVNQIQQNGGPAFTLTNDDNHTIRGAGLFGLDNLTFTNDGLVDANQPAGLTFNTVGSSNVNVNHGVIQASGGGQATFNLVEFDNSDGLIQALAGSMITVQGSAITGGDLHTEGNGFIRPFSFSTLRDFTLTGLIRQQNNDSAVYGGTITNNGTISLESTGAATFARVGLGPNPTTFTGSGEILMSNNTNNFVAFSGSPGASTSLINSATHTIRGAGRLGANSLNITNQGTITADQPQPLIMSGIFNNGTINATGAGGILAHDFLITSGTVNVATGSSFLSDGGYHQTAGNTIINGIMDTSSYLAEGTTTVNGLLKATGPSGNISIEGLLKGNGTITVSLLTGSLGIGHATLAVGDPIGSLEINGALGLQGMNSVLEFEIGGLIPGIEHDVLEVNGPVFAGGTLRIRFVNGFDPQVGDSFIIMGDLLHPGAPEDQYSFSWLDFPCNLPGRAVKLASTAYDIQIIEIIAAGDLIDVNCDCAQSLEIELAAFIKALIDPAAFATQYPGCPITSADRNNDGLVNGRDVQPFVYELLN